MLYVAKAVGFLFITWRLHDQVLVQLCIEHCTSHTADRYPYQLGLIITINKISIFVKGKNNDG